MIIRGAIYVYTLTDILVDFKIYTSKIKRDYYIQIWAKRYKKRNYYLVISPELKSKKRICGTVSVFDSKGNFLDYYNYKNLEDRQKCVDAWAIKYNRNYFLTITTKT